MDSIRSWAFSVCAAMVTCGVARMILPKGSMQKVFSVTVSAFFLCCLIAPAISGSALPEVSVIEYSQEEIERRAKALEEAVASQTDKVMEWNIEKIVSEKLAGMGIKEIDIAINISTDGQNGPAVERVDITLPKEHEARHEAILLELRNDLKLKIYLGYE